MLPRKRKKMLIIFVTIFFILFFIIKMLNKNTNVLIDEKNIDKVEWLESFKEEEYTGTTYYVSSTGTSKDGTDINSPMSLETAKSKYYKGGDKILLKRGDTFYGQFAFSGTATANKPILVSAYGEGERPIISVAKIISNRKVWENVSKNIYRVDLTNIENFSGCMMTDIDSCNIGLFTDKDNNIYGAKKDNLEKLLEKGDFYSDEKYFYVYSNGNPTDVFGTIKMSIKKDILWVGNFTEICNIALEYSSSHAIVKASYPLSYSYIHDCLINYIGGGYQHGNTRYGNAIEMYDGTYNVIIENNIIKNVYDAGITLQGNKEEWNNILIKGNIIVNTCYPLELWAKQTSTGLKNIEITDNIVINQGYGWSQKVRPDGGVSANYVFYTYSDSAKMDINTHNNRFYNSYRLYYIADGSKTKFKEQVKNDQNNYYITENAYVVNNIKDDGIKEFLNTEYNIEYNSKFNFITNNNVNEISNEEILSSNDYNEIKEYYDDFDIRYRNEKISKNIVEKLEKIKEKNQSIFLNKNINVVYENLINQINKLYIDIDNIEQNAILSTYNMQKDLSLKIIEEYYNGNLLDISEKELLTLLEDLDKMSENYIDLFSYYVSKDNIDSKDVMNKLNDTIEKYNMYNASIDIENTKNLIEKAKKLYNNSIQTNNIYENMLNKQRILNITETITSIFDIKVENCINEEKSKIKITYDKDINSLTSENITVKLTIGENTKITNNGGKNTYTFTKNGTFKFVLDIIGNIYEVPITISNISKEYIVDNQFIKNITKETSLTELKENLNLNNYTVIRNGKVIDTQNSLIATGDILKTDSNQYTLIVCGDINSDGKVSAYDIVEYRKYLLEYTKFNDIKGKGADTNNDNILDAKDLVGLRKIILN